MSKTYSAGIVTAYGAAKRAGYTGTYEDFCRQQAQYAENAAAVEQATNTAVSAASTATAKAGEAATAATAAQTAKTQTEAAASQALTDISTARSGAISAVQTEGATQTANATAQAQAAATSATTASTKASEASASATTATTKATEAAASATSAAQSASDAQDVLDSIPADYSDLSANVSQLQADLDDNVNDLKSALNNSFPIKPNNTTFFDGVNYFDSDIAVYGSGLAINASGELFTASAGAKYLIVAVQPSTNYVLYVPDANRRFIGEKETDDFASGQTITMLVTANGDYPCSFTTGPNAHFVFIYFNSGDYNYDTNKNLILLCEGALNYGDPVINNRYIGKLPAEKLDIFIGANLFDPVTAVYRTDRNINTSGVVFSSSSAKTITFPVEPDTTYSLYVPDGNRSFVAEDNVDGTFAIGNTHTMLVTNATLPYPIKFTTGALAKYVFVTINVGDYDYNNKKAGIKLVKGKYWDRPKPYIPLNNMDDSLNNLYGANVLIFGDSITDCCNITTNSDNETTAYSWKNPSNSYIDGNGNAIAYSMWAKILKENQPLGEIRNYALSGASIISAEREAGSERLNLQYQVDLALNDVDNPNGVFAVDHYVPDIVIFAIGTNDVAPNDTYEQAMSVVTYQTDGVSVDVSTTMAQLDPTKFCESARLAFLKIKQAFPLAQLYFVLPLQRARYQQNTTNMHVELKKIAERYGCIIIDGTFTSGVIAEFETVSHLGALLKDGLHPNDKGQNVMARMILSALKANYQPFGNGFNIIT